MTPGAAERWPRVILHADMDAFFASVEQLDNPDLVGQPVVVGGTGRRGVVSAASYEARRFGIHSAMPSHEARSRCPEAHFVPVRHGRYGEVSEQVMRVFDDFSPLVEPLSVDEAFLDMSGAEQIFGPPPQMGQKLRAAVFEATGGLTVSVGVATTKYVAKVASDQDKPDGLTVVPPDGVEAFLWPLPITRLWGVGKRTQPKLEALGLRTIGDVAHSQEALLVEHLGALGEKVWHLARGDDPREVIPEREAKSIGAEYTLDRDIQGAAKITRHLRRAADKVAPRLRRHDLRAAAVRVKLKTARFKLLTHQVQLPVPTDSAKVILEAAVGLLPQFNLREQFRLVGLAAFDLRSAEAPVQSELFGEGDKQRNRRLEATLDELRGKFGKGVLQRGSELRPKSSDDE